MTFSRLQSISSLLLAAASICAACSLTVPAEDELFGPSRGGAGGASSGGTLAQAGGNGGVTSGVGGVLEPNLGGVAGDDGGSVAPEGGTDGSAPTEPVAGAGGSDEPGSVELPPASLFLHYDFDDVSELVAKDASGHGHDGTLAGLSLPGGAAGHIKGALKLDGAQKQYVQLPNDFLDQQPAVSISSWLKLGQALAWDRLFDFNSGESNWFFFSPTGWNTETSTFGTRCATRTPSALAPEIMLTETVSIDTWHHIAVVFAKPFLRYYLDGQLKAELTNLKFASGELGKTKQNWIGRSVYPADPFLTGLVDDFRVYTGALTAEEVSALAEK